MPKNVLLGALAVLIALSCAPAVCQDEEEEEMGSPISIEILSPVEGATYPAGSPIEFSFMWSAEDSVGEPAITCALDGAPGPVSGETRTDLAEGQHVYAVSAQVGDVTVTSSVTFTVTAPTATVSVAIASPTDGATYAYGAPITFDYNVTVDGTSEAPVVVTTLNGQPGPAKGEALSNLAPGLYTYYVTATAAGVSASGQAAFTVGNSVGCVTGGGWFKIGASKCAFTLAGMCKPKTNAVRGNLLYIDKAARLHVKASAISALGISAGSAVLQGTCAINGEAGHTFSVLVTSAGKCKKKVQTFSIALDTGYAVSGTLKGGCITINKAK